MVDLLPETLQRWQAVEPSCSATVPARHSSQKVCEAEAVLPAGHGWHCVEPCARETAPGGQGAQAVEREALV